MRSQHPFEVALLELPKGLKPLEAEVRRHGTVPIAAVVQDEHAVPLEGPRKWPPAQFKPSEFTGTLDNKKWLHLKPGDLISHVSIQAEYDEAPNGIDVDWIRIEAIR